MSTQSPDLAVSADWISIARAAAEKSVSVKTIRRMIARGEIEARRFGPRLIRVNRASLENAGRPIGGAR